MDRLRRWIIGAGVLLLGACSVLRLTYGSAPNLTYWWLDGYVEFDAGQGERARDALADWFAWHRATQLPDYAGLLASARRQMLHDITPAQVCRWVDVLRQRLEAGYERGVPALAAMVRTLSARQLQRIERRYREADDEIRDEYLRPAPAERQAGSTRRVVARAERIYGELEPAQRELLAQGMADSPFDASLWLAERQARQREIVDTLRTLHSEHADDARTQAALRLFAAHAARSPRAAYREYQQRLFDHQCALFARLHNSATAEQRRRGAQRLADWEADLRALAGTDPLRAALKEEVAP
ncbi:MAG: hypothetical protein LKCHEGNO_03028 [Burkholderiaceae bacterium]|nr:hypothetical protein [Burkholderiaceae bacterium]